nr:LEA type 2 family protein [uncultured Holophaga sp.]
MRAAWLVLPGLAALVSCRPPDSAAAYRKAASQLKYRIERVEPRLDMALPLDRSRLVVRIRLKVENPSEVRFHARRVAGDLGLDELGQMKRVGAFDLPQGLTLEPHSEASVVLELTFTYRDIRRNWASISQAIEKGPGVVWRVEGRATLEAFGLPFSVPFKARGEQ